jgi:Spy/CpxP family protein refolding chaperone
MKKSPFNTKDVDPFMNNEKQLAFGQSKELGLTEEQRPKVESIFNAEKQKVEAIFNEERQKLQLVQEETRSSLQSVLTPEQMDKLDKKMREQARKNGALKK